MKLYYRASAWFWGMREAHHKKRADLLETEGQDLAVDKAILHTAHEEALARITEAERKTQQYRRDIAFYDTLIDGGVNYDLETE